MALSIKDGDRVRYNSKGDAPSWDGSEGVVVEVKSSTIGVRLTTPVSAAGEYYPVGTVVVLSREYLTVLEEDYNKKDAVNHPAHYGGEDNPYEVIKVAEAWGLDKDAYLFNVLKYVARAGKKEAAKELEDLKKGRFYIDRRITEREAKALAANS